MFLSSMFLFAPAVSFGCVLIACGGITCFASALVGVCAVYDPSETDPSAESPFSETPYGDKVAKKLAVLQRQLSSMARFCPFLVPLFPCMLESPRHALVDEHS